jgi:hypothetical protein
MKRREFLAKSATVAGAILPNLAIGQDVPCPPPSFSASGGTSASASCGLNSSTVTTLSVSAGRSTVPWTFGQIFKAGDVPSGTYIASNLSNFQADVRNRWPDGSVKFAVLSGVSPSQMVEIQRTTTAPVGGENVREPKLDVAVTFSGEVTGEYNLVKAQANGRMGWNRSTPHLVRQFVAGPVMSEFHYYVPTNDPDVGLFFYVRAYSNGAYEVETTIENGFYGTAATTDKTYTVSVAVAGTRRWSKTVEHYRHARYALQFWSDPSLPGPEEVTVRHDLAYLKSTLLVPNYMEYRPSESRLAGLPQGWDPWQFRTVGDGTYVQYIQASQGGTGWVGTLDVFGRWGALYCTSGDPRAYTSSLAHYYTRGTWSVHARDPGTGLPLKFESHKTAHWTTGGPAPVGARSNTPTAPDTSHVPDSGILGYWLTGRYFFLEELQFWVQYAWLSVNSNKYWLSPTDGTYRYPNNTTRATAWTIRNLAGLATIIPDDDTTGSRSQYIGHLNWLFPLFENIFVSGTAPYGADGQIFANKLGVMYWGETYPETRPWMQDFVVSILSWCAEIGLPVTATAQRDLVSWRNFMCGQAIGRCGINPGEWHYTYAARYGGPSAYCIYERRDPGSKSNRSGANLWNTWGEVWNHTLSVNDGGSSTPLPAKFPAATEGQLLVGANIESGALTTSYWAYLGEALALSVDAGVPGADAAYRRVTTAPNWRQFESDFGNNPEHGRRPRRL